jgi:hypothetical protein
VRGTQPAIGRRSLCNHWPRHVKRVGRSIRHICSMNYFVLVLGFCHGIQHLFQAA